MNKPLSIFLALLSPLLIEAQDLPDRYEVLTQNYQRAIERANKPITQKYIAELKLLLKEVTQKGDLKQALEIEGKLKELGEVEKTLRDILLSREWYYTANKYTKKMEFKPGGKWRLDDDLTLTILYNGGNSCTFKFPDLKTLSVQGRTKNGNELRTLRPVE